MDEHAPIKQRKVKHNKVELPYMNGGLLMLKICLKENMIDVKRGKIGNYIDNIEILQLN